MSPKLHNLVKTSSGNWYVVFQTTNRSEPKWIVLAYFCKSPTNPIDRVQLDYEGCSRFSFPGGTCSLGKLINASIRLERTLTPPSKRRAVWDEGWWSPVVDNGKPITVVSPFTFEEIVKAIDTKLTYANSATNGASREGTV